MGGGLNMSAPPAAPFKISTFTLEQGPTVEPDSSIWVTASAGTGKTHVLSARVVRLLCDGVPPEAILCVTYTRAAAAEMAQRIFARLSHFIRSSDVDLSAELKALGHKKPNDAAEIARARTLFARTLEAPGGLKIQTIHSFCQSLLGRFPLEADLAPGFKLLDDRTSTGIGKQVLEGETARAAMAHDTQFLDDFSKLAVQLDEGILHKNLSTLASALRKLNSLELTPANIDAHMRRALGLSLSETPETVLQEFIQSDILDNLRYIRQVWMNGGSRLQGRCPRLLNWIASPTLTTLDNLYQAFLTAKFAVFSDGFLSDSVTKIYDPAALEKTRSIASHVSDLRQKMELLHIAETGAAVLRVAWRIADSIARGKQALGLVSYDDLIERCVNLLDSDAGDWVRYKLDAKITHVLVDEAQDTNAAQWSILKSLTEEFSVGASAREANRSLFVVGDLKQAIFRFQGSDPKNFAQTRTHFENSLENAETPLIKSELTTSFRSAPMVIDFVNEALKKLPENALGADTSIETHLTDRLKAGGAIFIWPRLVPDKKEEDNDDDLKKELELTAKPKSERIIATRIAAQIQAWTAPNSTARLRGRPIVPGDIMVLVQNRAGLGQALVADLKSRNVPVAGIDRLMLSKPLVVQDLLACARFAILPEDDLTLAGLLKSPLFGWSDSHLYQLATRRAHGVTLWSALRDQTDDFSRNTTADLEKLLNAADYSPPYNFFADILQNGGREKLFSRLGSESDDPIEALLNAALNFENEHAPSLQAFITWIEDDTSELKREAETARNEVRIMTVHGAKGLQAKIVILADAHRLPAARKEIIWPRTGTAQMPLWLKSKNTGVAIIDAAQEAEDQLKLEDYWRLFYVAITRAEDWLCFAGWEKPAPKETDKEPKKTPPPSWHNIATSALTDMGAETTDDAIWGLSLHLARTRTLPDEPPVTTAKPAPTRLAIPVWATQAAPLEPVPPRPFTPSRLGGEDALMGDAPLMRPALQTSSTANAITRGVLIHRLLELLPALPEATRTSRIAAWGAAHGIPAPECIDIANEVIAVLNNPTFKEAFRETALAEVPITAVLGKAVLNGKIDRLVVTKDTVLIVDYKTNRTVPESPSAVPLAYLRQMAAYRMALRQIYPNHPIQCALLWTATPCLMTLPDTLLDETEAAFGA
jgi:ATP-dependent helicase/nuclease subunit A